MTIEEKIRHWSCRRQNLDNHDMRLSVYILPRETAATVFSAKIPGAADPVWQKRYSQKGRRIPPESYDRWRRDVLTAAKEPLAAAEIREAVGIPEDVVKPLLNRMAFEGSLFRIGSENAIARFLGS